MINKLVFSLTVLFIFSSFGSYSSGKEVLRIKGSNTVLPVIEEATLRWQELRSDVIVEASGPGSGAGFSALLDGIADIAPMSRVPKENELSTAKSNGFNITQSVIGKDALIIVVHSNNPITSLSTKNISDIYSGIIRDWTEFDSSISFADTKIKVVERDENSGTHDYFNDFFLEGSSVPSNTLGSYYSQHTSTSKLFEIVKVEENAIGYGGLAYLTNKVRTVKVDNIEPTVENAKTDKYPVARELLLVWDSNTLSKVGKEFTDYMLTPEGQFVVNQAGYIPITTAASSYTSISNTQLTGGLLLTSSVISMFFAIVIINRKRA